MKTLYLTLCLVVISALSHAQPLNAILKENLKMPLPANTQSIMSIDTLSQYFDRAKGFTIYSSQDGGFVFGTSYNYDSASTSYLPVSDETGLHYDGVANASVTELLFWAGSATVNGTADDIYGNVYSVGADSMPVSLLGSSPINMANVVASTSAAFNSVLISPAANTNGNSFFVSLAYTSIDDTLGIVSTNKDSADGHGEKRIRQLASSSFGGGWRRMGELYNFLDLDVVIIPVVNTTVGINSPFELKDASLAPIFPSPSKDKVTLSYNLKKESKISYKLFDITGKVFYQQQAKTTASGKHAETFDISKFASGKYYLTFTCNGSPVTQSITVIK